MASATATATAFYYCDEENSSYEKIDTNYLSKSQAYKLSLIDGTNHFLVKVEMDISKLTYVTGMQLSNILLSTENVHLKSYILNSNIYDTDTKEFKITNQTSLIELQEYIVGEGQCPDSEEVTRDESLYSHTVNFSFFEKQHYLYNDNDNSESTIYSFYLLFCSSSDDSSTEMRWIYDNNNYNKITVDEDLMIEMHECTFYLSKDSLIPETDEKNIGTYQILNPTKTAILSNVNIQLKTIEEETSIIIYIPNNYYIEYTPNFKINKYYQYYIFAESSYTFFLYFSPGITYRDYDGTFINSQLLYTNKSNEIKSADNYESLYHTENYPITLNFYDANKTTLLFQDNNTNTANFTVIGTNTWISDNKTEYTAGDIYNFEEGENIGILLTLQYKKKEEDSTYTIHFPNNKIIFDDWNIEGIDEPHKISSSSDSVIVSFNTIEDNIINFYKTNSNVLNIVSKNYGTIKSVNLNTDAELDEEKGQYIYKVKELTEYGKNLKEIYYSNTYKTKINYNSNLYEDYSNIPYKYTGQYIDIAENGKKVSANDTIYIPFGTKIYVLETEEYYYPLYCPILSKDKLSPSYNKDNNQYTLLGYQNTYTQEIALEHYNFQINNNNYSIEKDADNNPLSISFKDIYNIEHSFNFTENKVEINDIEYTWDSTKKELSPSTIIYKCEGMFYRYNKDFPKDERQRTWKPLWIKTYYKYDEKWKDSASFFTYDKENNKWLRSFPYEYDGTQWITL